MRWGVEKFLLLPWASDDSTCLITEKLRRVMLSTSREVLPAGVTARIGAVSYRQGESETALFKRVKEVMYAVMRHGKDAMAHEHLPDFLGVTGLVFESV